MADPVYDEDYILHLLAGAPTLENVERLQAGAVQALIDLHDRKATREVFCSDAAACLTMYGQLAKLWMLSRVEEAHDLGELNSNAFKDARQGLQDLIRKHAMEVAEIVRSLQKCPTSQDKVH